MIQTSACLGVPQSFHCTPNPAVQYIFPSISRSIPLIQTPIHIYTTHKASMSDYGLPLGRLYGPAWIKRNNWGSGFLCIWEARMDQVAHHCPGCNGVIKDSCYKKHHVAFCLHPVDANGHQRFCGHRFKVEKSGACLVHGWGENNENRVFLDAKQGRDYKLPNSIPHEQSGWEMKLNNFGPLNSPAHIRMKLVGDERYFVRVLSYLANGQPDATRTIARVKPQEFLVIPWTGPPAEQP